MSALRVSAPVAAAIAAGRPVVALESSVLAQGLPIPANRDAAERMVAAVEEGGAVAAITAVVRGPSVGVPALGLEPDELERFLRREGVRKVASRDIAVACAQNADGATTVAASLCIAHAAGVPVFATGGIGGVHRDAPFDESGDLAELARTPMIVVCAGAKSILDLPATLERLETLGVTVIGYRTSELPGFFTRTSGLRLGARVESVQEIAGAWRVSRALGRRQAILVVQPPPEHVALPQALVDEAVRGALAQARGEGIRGAAVTPFLLGAVLTATEGRSLPANLGLLEENARLAGEIAAALRERAVGGATAR
ncbi:MAG: Pseudouridine-5-phosphate glycosidase [Gemmatimonadetes bacterium]|jgi:pseudouridine-5'-phosphate glycosidase|nr:Pseudouridine-5-phosphate glycosidase [Gemmatimonadota bacterium]